MIESQHLWFNELHLLLMAGVAALATGALVFRFQATRRRAKAEFDRSTQKALEGQATRLEIAAVVVACLALHLAYRAVIRSHI